MSRLPRLFVPGFPQLITQRGNNRTAVFLDDEDYAQYLRHLREALRETGVQLHAWVLMPDHVHLLVSADAAPATGQVMQRLGRRYVRWFNDRHGRSGTLWEGRYRSTALEPDAWLLAASRYVELNPVRSGLVGSPEHHPWSSCRHHLGLERDPLVTDHAAYWALGNTPFERQAAWRTLLTAGEGQAALAAIRYAAHRGWMLGEAPAAPVDAPLVRRAAPLPRGRPRRAGGAA
ncbi:MAG: transposase [Candidatus Dactylopiibacterium sp.]|nr:transposase [Candidatus Dactylopiibacterium sp.]